MSAAKPLLPPLQERIAVGAPVFTQEQAQALTRRVMELTTVERAVVNVQHIVRSVTRLASNRVRSTDDGETLSVNIRTEIPERLAGVTVETNQLDETALREMVLRADAIVNGTIGSKERVRPVMLDEQDTYRPATLWHDTTVQALREARETAVPQIVDAVRQQGGSGGRFRASGFIGVVAKAEAILTSAGVTGYCRHTDNEISVTVRSNDGKASGWQGQAHRDWARLDPRRVSAEAADVAARSVAVVAIEPGRRTAILAPGAVVQFMRFLALHFSANDSALGRTGFSKVPWQMMGARWHQRIFDPRVHITSDPADPDGGYLTYYGSGWANPAITWINNGVLENLAMSPSEALGVGKVGSDMPFGLRMRGGDVTLDQMIARCEEGIYVNRVSGIDIVDMTTGMLTGVTTDGCFLVRKGKIERPVKNFRFFTSPFFMLNALVAMGPTARAAFGYAPPMDQELRLAGYRSGILDWPRRPMIVPPLMVNDFNFSALIDAV